MTENEEYLKSALTHAQKFEENQEPESLKQACQALENVQWREELDLEVRVQQRRESLHLWLHLLQLIDTFLDPKFDPDDVPELTVQPPPTTAGVVYPPGVDPARIDDPTARAKYEKEIAANQVKTRNYNLQTKLHRLDQRITPRAEDFINNSYTTESADQAELVTAIETTIKKSERKATLLKLLTPTE